MTAAARARRTTSRSQLLPLHSSDYKEGGVSGMNTTDGLTAPGFFSRERTIAKPGFNRWLVPPAALAIHLCIGMAYGFSVFWKPLQGALLGADGKPLAGCAANAVSFGDRMAGTLGTLTATDCNWTQFGLG